MEIYRKITRIIIVIWTMFYLCNGLCTYPSDIRGTWQDSVYGLVDFSDSAMNMQTKGFLSGTSSTNFTCEINTGDFYVSKSVGTITIQIYGGLEVNVYICMEMKSLNTSVSYYYNLASSDQSNSNYGDVVPIRSGSTPTSSEICNTTPDERLFHMLLKSASASTGLSTCGVPLIADFTYTMNFGTAVTECDSSAFWKGCSNTSVISLNNTGCGTQFVGYSASGYLGCVYSVQDTTTPTIYYVGVYNFDTSVNGPSTTRFTCFAVEQHDSYTNVSQSPDKCASDQTPSSLPTKGALLQLTTISSCSLSPLSTLSTLSSLSPLSDLSDLLTIGEILAIVFTIMLVIFLAFVIGICLYRRYIRKHEVKIIIIPKTLPKGAHTVLTMSDTSTVVNKEIITEPNLVVKPIRNGQPQSMELQQWKHNSEFQEPEGQLTIVRKPQPPVERIDTMKSRVATQMREDAERRRNMSSTIDRVKTNLDRELRVISLLKEKDASAREDMTREITMSKLSHATALATSRSRMSRHKQVSPATRTASMRKNKVPNGDVPNVPAHNHSLNSSFDIEHRTSTPLSVRPSSIDIVMSEANLSIFSSDLKYRKNKTPKPQPDITVTKRIKDTRKFPTIKELSDMHGDFQNFER